MNKVSTEVIIDIEKLIPSTEATFIRDNSEGLIEIFSTIETNVTQDNMEEMSKISTNLNKFAKKISDDRIKWKKEVTKSINEDEAKIKAVHQILSSKREEIKSNADVFLEQLKTLRIEAVKEFFNDQVKNYSLYDFITFDEFIMEESYKTKGACTYNDDGSIKALAKKTRDSIEAKLEKFTNDKLTLDTFCLHTGDSSALVTYESKAKQTGVFDAASAIKQAELVIERNKELAAFKEAKKEVDQEATENIKGAVKLATKTENQQAIIKKKSNTTTFIVEVPNESKPGFTKMLRDKQIKFTIEGE